jgi:hypothetical protein
MLINEIKAIINPDVHIEVINNKNGQGIVILEEKGQDAKLKKVSVRGFEANQTFAFKLDVEGKRISDYLNPSAKNINKGSDGIIFTRLENKWYVFICELKSGSPVEKEYLLQFRNSHVFVKCMMTLLEEFYSFDLTEKFSVKYILFDKHQKNKLNKTRTKGNKIEAEELVSEDHKKFYVYKIHHLREHEFLNIRHLELD